MTQVWKPWAEAPCSGCELGENEPLLEQFLTENKPFDSGFLKFSELCEDEGNPLMRIYGDGNTVTVEMKETFDGGITPQDCCYDDDYDSSLEKRLFADFVGLKYEESSKLSCEYCHIDKLTDIVYDCGEELYNNKEATLEEERRQFDYEVESWFNPEPDYDSMYELYAEK